MLHTVRYVHSFQSLQSAHHLKWKKVSICMWALLQSKCVFILVLLRMCLCACAFFHLLFLCFIRPNGFRDENKKLSSLIWRQIEFCSVSYTHRNTLTWMPEWTIKWSTTWYGVSLVLPLPPLPPPLQLLYIYCFSYCSSQTATKCGLFAWQCKIS